jgi:MFS family permease
VHNQFQTARDDRYKWVALANTTAAMFMATLDGSIVIIALPAIFRGIHLDPLAPGNISYLLWMIMGYRLVQAVLVVSVGRLGDMFGRVRIYNSGFVVFTAASILLSFDPFEGSRGALWLIGWRVLQAVGGSMLMANSAAILTDAFPAEQRGFALGTNQIAGLAGMFVGLVAGGLLAAIDWRAVFWVNVPVGIYGTVWAYLRLRDNGERHRARIDWWGNLTFAVGLSAVLIAVTYSIQPYGGHAMGWTNPWVLAGLVGGVALLGVFVLVENRIPEPMFQLSLFRIRAFTAGNLAGLAVSIARGGLQFVLIIWLQGIWLPLHGYDYSDTPLWAGIFLLPLTAGFLVSGPVAGFLSDRFSRYRHRRAGGLRRQLHRLDAAARRLPFPGLCAAHCRERDRERDVCRAQLLLDHGQRPGPAARCSLGHALDVPELRHGVVDRGVLLGHDRRAGQQPAEDAGQRPAAPGRAVRRRPPDRLPAAGVVAVRGGPRREPAGPPAGGPRRAVLPPGRGPADHHRPGVLPRSDLRPLPARLGRGVRPGHRPDRAGRPGVRAARRPARPPAGLPPPGLRPAAPGPGKAGLSL